MADYSTSVACFRAANLPPSDGSSSREESLSRAPSITRLVAEATLGAGLWLAVATGNVQWPDEAVPRSLAPRSTGLTAELRPGGRSLRELAEDAVARMTPEQRALYDEILRISRRFGEPIDVNALLREVREDAG